METGQDKSAEEFFEEGEVIEVEGGYYDEFDFYWYPDGSFYDPDGVKFDTNGVDKFGGHYTLDLEYIPADEMKDKIKSEFMDILDEERKQAMFDDTASRFTQAIKKLTDKEQEEFDKLRTKYEGKMLTKKNVEQHNRAFTKFQVTDDRDIEDQEDDNEEEQKNQQVDYESEEYRQHILNQIVKPTIQYAKDHQNEKIKIKLTNVPAKVTN